MAEQSETLRLFPPSTAYAQNRNQRQAQHIATCIIILAIGAAILMAGMAAIIASAILLSRPTVGTTKEATSGFAVEEYYNMSDSILGVYKRAAVAADAAACSTVGKRILQRGGSAVDAAIAVGLCNGAHTAQSVGIGGGLFMVVYNKTTQKAVTIVARETAPQAANATMFTNLSSDASKRGGLAIAVPGEVAGYRRAWEMFGRLPWHELFNDTIAMLENGYPCGRALAQAIQRTAADIKASPSMSEAFVNPATGNLIQEGNIIRNPKLATTLRTIAANWTEFYAGSLASTIVEEIRAAGGIITLQDLRDYSATVSDAVSITLSRDHSQLYSAPPPSSGVVLAYIMNILDGYKMGPDSVSTTDKSVLTHHRMLEAFKFAFAARSRLGDPRFVPMDKLTDSMKSESYGEEIRLRINDDQTHPPEYYGGDYGNRDTLGTGHWSVLSPDGDAVATTSTINLYFGSTVRGSRTGIIYNNQMDDFSTPGQANYFGLAPSPANFIAPGKRPLSSMCPAIVVDRNGSVRLVGGASGGPKIVTTVAYVVMNNLWFERNIKESVDLKRLHHQLYPNVVTTEPGFDQRFIDGLSAKGHLFESAASTFSIFQGIAVAANGTVFANSDYRKGGAPDGY